MKFTRRVFTYLASLTLIALAAFATVVVETKSPISVTPVRANCYCKISQDNLWQKSTATGVIKDLTAEVGTSYTGVYQQSDENQTNCTQECKKKAQNYLNSPAIGAAACAAGVPNQTWLNAWAAVGTRDYEQAMTIGLITNTPQINKTVCTCPATWQCNGCSPQVVGGITTDGHCKKVVGTITLPPYPPDGTQIGSWGFTWGNSVQAWGTSANGGAPSCVTNVITPAVCGICCG